MEVLVNNPESKQIQDAKKWNQLLHWIAVQKKLAELEKIRSMP